ncbi:MAG: Gldg family protein [Victivallales bacterium]|nr:Gldg family protein [Victivallales bacterium]
MSDKQSKTMRTGLAAAIAVVVVAAILILLCSLFQNTNWRLDCTEGKIHTFSDATIQTLKNLKKNVNIKFYYSKDVAEMPVVLKNYAARIEDILREYEIHGDGHIRVSRLNPKPDTDAEDSANLDGISGQPGDALGLEENIYLGIAVTCADHTEALPFLSPERENLLEYDLTRAIIAVSNPVKHKLGVMSAMQVFGGIDDPAAMMQGQGGMKPAWLIINELKKTYDVSQVDLEVAEIPADIDMLLVIHPRGISEKTQFAIDQFVLRGGRLIAFVDPMSLADMQSQPRQQMQYMPPTASSNLDKLFEAWGVTFSPDEVVLDRERATVVRANARSAPEPVPNVLSLLKDDITQGDPATAQIATLMMLNAGSFGGKAPEGLTRTVLLKSTTESQTMDKYMTQRNPSDLMRDLAPDGTSKELIIRLTGTFQTAFPNGAPKEKEEGKDEAKKEEAKAEEAKAEEKPALTKSEKPGAVVLVADSDMLYDPFCVRQGNIFGQSFYQPINNNLALVQNLVEALSGDVVLFEIRSRGVTPRPFTRVREMENAAAEKYRSEIQKFEGEVEKFQQEIRDLQRNRKQGDAELLSREQKDAVARIQKKQAEARRNLKEVRKQQRKDIEALENRMMLVNIALMPALVVLFGIALALFKRMGGASK